MEDAPLFTRSGRLSDADASLARKAFHAAEGYEIVAPSHVHTSLDAELHATYKALGFSSREAELAHVYGSVMIGTSHLACELRSLSSQHYDEPEALGPECLVRGGFSGVVQCAARDAGGSDTVRLGCPVSRILQCGGAADSDHAVCVVLTSGERITARSAICTVPLGVMQASMRGDPSALAFEPPLTEAASAAMLRLGFGNMEKLMAVFPFDPLPQSQDLFFFLDVGSPGGPSVPGPGPGTPAALCPVTCFSKRLMADGSTSITGLCSGDASAALSLLSDADAQAVFFAQLACMFGGALPPCAAFARTAWAADPWARGSYSFMALGATPADRAALSAPLWGGALWLAGEHATDRSAGYTHGAYDSGARAAEGVLSMALA